MTRLRRKADEAGASLVIILIFVMVVSVLALGLLSFAQASFQSTDAVRTARQLDYSADAATELAISNVLKDKSGDLGSPFGLSGCNFTLQGINGTNTTVVCKPNNGAGGLVPGKALNAILTLSPTFPLTLTGNDTLYVTGRVYSHGGIVTGNSVLDSSSVIISEGTHNPDDCLNDNKVKAAILKTCNAASSEAGNDPMWSPPSKPGTPAAVDFSKCSSGKKSTDIVIFSPGTYTDSPADLADGNKNCNNSVLYFKPGAYYFQSVFDVGGHELVAGTAAGNWLSDGTPPPQDGSACDNAQPGAEFVFGAGGGMIALDTNATPHITICAGPAGSQPAIAIYGLRSSQGGMNILTNPNALQTGKKPFVFMHGAVYLPTSRATISMHNKSQTSYDGAVVLYELNADVNPSIKQDSAPFSLIACTIATACRTDRDVIFTASVPGRQLLRTVLQINDGGGGTPGLASSLTQWSVLP